MEKYKIVIPHFYCLVYSEGAHKITLEIDFISRRNGKVLPIEIKATNGNSKSLKEVLTNPIYECDEGIKFYDGNVSKNDKYYSLPHFLSVFFKGEYE